ncbi:hypothetical protein GQ55_8G190700 [Panicum hallii var. hallii]|uniref:Chalcone/stilbene synthase N-terminal domain-containing protein n=1 Tax=Panicum hallii var. hallii TaxID=1504633 RepID=A0A2T7CNZ7_9POAL|nr:hypothetical protein GQ55_8G190700 [Panicum hallii var. hallii]
MGAAALLEQNQRAAVLAIGTANPANCVLQDEFPDWYFRVTRSEHHPTLKAKMKRICEKSGIRKRHFHLTEEMIGSHPELLDRPLPSLSALLRITADALPELAAAAAEKAIAEWGRPATDITHLILSTNSSGGVPGPDVRLAALLGLRPTVQRTTLYLHGCSAGAAVFPIAKDLAENDDRARVLVVCAETIVIGFGAPDEANPNGLVVNSLFGDGAGAAIIGAGPVAAVERPIFHMVSSSQSTLPRTEPAVWVRLGESGLGYNLSAELPALVRSSIEKCLVDALAPLGLAAGAGGWNSLFWAMHPGGRAILDSYEAALGLEPGKLAASRHVLGQYGNMLGATIIFVLDEVRRRRQGGDAGGDVACEWGVMLALGPGLTVETMVLHAAGSRDEK